MCQEITASCVQQIVDFLDRRGHSIMCQSSPISLARSGVSKSVISFVSYFLEEAVLRHWWTFLWYLYIWGNLVVVVIVQLVSWQHIT